MEKYILRLNEYSQKIKDFYKVVFNPLLSLLRQFKVPTNLFPLVILFFIGLVVLFLMLEQHAQAGAMCIVVAVVDICGTLLLEEKAVENIRPKETVLGFIIHSYSEILLYTGLMVFCIQSDEYVYALFAYLSLIGTLMSGFIRNKLDVVAEDARFDFLQRQERLIVLSFGMLIGLHGIGITSFLVAIITNFASCYFITKIWFVKK